ncbi:MAG: peptidoglycan DD-metalloendopeptidase family protein [Pseudomonadota bacterium]
MIAVARPLAACAALALAAAAPDSYSRDELGRLEAEKAEAERQLTALENATAAVSGDLAGIDEQLISAAMESRRREEQAAAAEMRLIDLNIRQRSAQNALLDDEAALVELLGALVSSGRRHPPAMVVAPARANQSVRAAILMGDAAPRLAANADDLAGEIERLAKLERNIRRERARLDAAEAGLALKKAEIEQLAAAKRAHYEDISVDAEAARRRVAALAEQASTLRDLLAALEADAPLAPARKPAGVRLAALSPPSTVTDAAPPRPQTRLRPLGAGENARLRQPAAGLVARAFGDRNEAGVRQDGLTLVTRRDAQVVSPADGVIEYADDFRSYGPTLILRTTDGYHVVLSGLAVIYGARSQEVAAGEPVGRMPNRAQPPPELYMELRRGDDLLDPAKWMRGR